jgi:NitT/TauT family transport system ATP-binding protein
MLERAPDKRLTWEVFTTALSLELSPDEAERQLETAVNWARYAELFSYDNDDNVLFIEQETPLPQEAGE